MDRKRIKDLLFHGVTIFATTFLMAAVVTYVYSLVAHGEPLVDWESSFRLGVIFGVVIPLSQRLEAQKGGHRS